MKADVSGQSQPDGTRGRPPKVRDAKCSRGQVRATGLPAEDSTVLRHRPPRYPLVNFHRESKYPGHKCLQREHAMWLWLSWQAHEELLRAPTQH